MSNIAIRCVRVGKSYPGGGRPERGLFAANLLSGFSKGRQPSVEQPWALKDVTFEITAGQTVGFVGRNGAGKSTLLKILSRITPPTEGYGEVYGKVASLLEVGTGFHPELTGRENVFLSGSFLGMNNREVAAKFDEIVAFAEVESLLDTPVKRYSSGQYVRLGFAVAAHLDQSIMLLDEVLGVGDEQFQTKCQEKIKELSEDGRTVLVVSHRAETIRSMCDKCIWLEGGKLIQYGDAAQVVDAYRDSINAHQLARV